MAVDGFFDEGAQAVVVGPADGAVLDGEPDVEDALGSGGQGVLETALRQPPGVDCADGHQGGRGQDTDEGDDQGGPGCLQVEGQQPEEERRSTHWLRPTYSKGTGVMAMRGRPNMVSKSTV